MVTPAHFERVVENPKVESENDKNGKTEVQEKPEHHTKEKQQNDLKSAITEPLDDRHSTAMDKGLDSASAEPLDDKQSTAMETDETSSTENADLSHNRDKFNQTNYSSDGQHETAMDTDQLSEQRCNDKTEDKTADAKEELHTEVPEDLEVAGKKQKNRKTGSVDEEESQRKANDEGCTRKPGPTTTEGNNTQPSNSNDSVDNPDKSSDESNNQTDNSAQNINEAADNTTDDSTELCDEVVFEEVLSPAKDVEDVIDFTKIPEVLRNSIGDYLRDQADSVNLTGIYKEVMKNIISQFHLESGDLQQLCKNEGFKSYVTACTELAWKMVIQRPRMYFSETGIGERWDEGSQEPCYGGDNPQDPASVVQYYVQPQLMHGKKLMVKGRVMTRKKTPQMTSHHQSSN